MGHTISEKTIFFLRGRSPIPSPVFIQKFPKKQETRGLDRWRIQTRAYVTSSLRTYYT
jgi:hypothetical protein